MSNQQNTLFTHIASLCCLIFILYQKPCQDLFIIRYHYSVVVKVFASGAEVSLGARVRIPIGADLVVMPTFLENIFMPFSTIKTEK